MTCLHGWSFPKDENLDKHMMYGKRKQEVNQLKIPAIILAELLNNII